MRQLFRSTKVFSETEIAVRRLKTTGLLLLSLASFAHVAAANTNELSQNTSAAVFVKLDTTTRGNWKGEYGADGYNIIADKAKYPPSVKVTPNDNLFNLWVRSSSDERALQKAESNDRIVGVWYRWSNDYFTINFDFSDKQEHQLAVYCLDWADPHDAFASSERRTETIAILDTFTRTVLDSQTLTNFADGHYLVWNVRGQVTMKVAHRKGDNAVISAFFFDKPKSVAKQ